MTNQALQNGTRIIGEKEGTQQIWEQAARVIIEGIPNSVVSHLGVPFNVQFYRVIAESEKCCAFFAIDESGTLQGIILGALEKEDVYYKPVREHPLQMAFAANFRLLSPSVLKWLLAGLFRKSNTRTIPAAEQAKAELIVIAVCPDSRGGKVAHALVEAMERRLVDFGGASGYNIFTEEANTRANRFYKKIGASFIETETFHGRRINKWFKVLPHD